MAFDFLSFEVDTGGIALLTIRRPEKLNALNATVISELSAAFQMARDDNQVKGLVLTGEGSKAFVAGADITEISELEAAAAERLSRTGQAAFRQLETMRKPSVAAIQGFALGGGLELALCTTVRIAADNAKLGLPELKLGLIPGYGGTQRLPRLIGKSRALELMLTGTIVSATDALRLGLVNEVVEPENLLAASKAWLAKLLANGPLAVALAMDVVETGLDMNLEAGLRLEASAFGLAVSSQDGKEGTRAFLEKRKATFTGK